MAATSRTSPAPHRTSWLRIITSLMAMMLGYIAIVGVCASLIEDNVAAMVAANLVTFLLYLAWLALRPGRKASELGYGGLAPRRLEALQWLQLAGLVAVLWFCGQIIAATIYQLVGSTGFDSVGQQQQASQLWTIALLLIAAPLGEEALMRGMILPRLRARSSVMAASIISASMFSFLHGNLVQVVLTLPLGILLGLVACHTGRIRETIVLHMAFNLLSVVVPAVLIGSAAHIASALVALALCTGGVIAGRRVLA